MKAEGEVDSSGLAQARAGDTLRRTREEAGVALEAVAAWTRIRQQHLSAIERSDFAALPAPMYAVAFARSYARAVGLDDEAIARQVRAEIDRADAGGVRRPTHHVPLEDPAKIPSARLSWGAVAVALAVLAGTSGFWQTALAPAGELPTVTSDESFVLAPELSPAAQIEPTAESAVAAAERGGAPSQGAAQASALRLAPAPLAQRGPAVPGTAPMP